MNESPLLVTHPDPATVVLTLNRPNRRNALTIELMELLCRTIAKLGEDPDSRVVILRGNGAAFCAGLDLTEAADSARAEEGARAVAETFEAVTATPLVVIAAAHGAAIAGGAGLMACCDIIIASEDLRIAFPEVRRGLVPALVSAALLNRIGDSALRELLLGGEAINSSRAREIGLVHRVVSTESLASEAEKAAAAILKGAPGAVRETKALLRKLRASGPREATRLAMEVHARVRHGHEATEGIAAFRDGREPRWGAESGGTT